MTSALWTTLIVAAALSVPLSHAPIQTPPRPDDQPVCREEATVSMDSASGNGAVAPRVTKACQRPPRYPSTPKVRTSTGQPRERLRPPTHPCDWTPIVERNLVGNEEACFTIPPGDPAAPSAPAAQAPYMVTAEDLRRLPIDPGTLTMQPAQDWVLVNIETIAYTDAQPQTFEVTLLDVPVAIRVEPLRHTWDFGPEARFTTKHPGAPYPEHTVFHIYERPTPPGETRTITLTTTWAGWFATAGGPWQPINGVATTTLTSDPFTVMTARTYLTHEGP